jgi:hypothetical protein
MDRQGILGWHFWSTVEIFYVFLGENPRRYLVAKDPTEESGDRRFLHSVWLVEVRNQSQI